MDLFFYIILERINQKHFDKDELLASAYFRALVVLGMGLALVLIYKQHRRERLPEPLPLTDEEINLRQQGDRLDLPKWASDPISYQLIIRPFLSLTSEPKNSHSFDRDTITLLNANPRYRGQCPFSKSKIKTFIPNAPLKEAITDWVQQQGSKQRRSPQAQSFFSNPHQRVPVPEWARCELSFILMKEPCIAWVNREYISVDKTIAQENRYPYWINHALREAIEDWTFDHPEGVVEPKPQYAI